MYKKLSDIDFSHFVGQKVIEVKSEAGWPLGVFFEKGVLIIECPWRLRDMNQIIMGYSDCKQWSRFVLCESLEKQIKGKKIVSVQHYENTSDFVLELEEGLFLELFHDSSMFEGWKLQGEQGLLVISLPGGSYEEF
ncbi:hypothetical protein CD798_05870 [Bacillaceae bacterium SAOS 7]|nr:hypothetical protein CD798_05870 [Bacillaceae bacterium SAOS 7]